MFPGNLCRQTVSYTPRCCSCYSSLATSYPYIRNRACDFVSHSSRNVEHAYCSKYLATTPGLAKPTWSLFPPFPRNYCDCRPPVVREDCPICTPRPDDRVGKLNSKSKTFKRDSKPAVNTEEPNKNANTTSNDWEPEGNTEEFDCCTCAEDNKNATVNTEELDYCCCDEDGKNLNSSSIDCKLPVKTVEFTCSCCCCAEDDKNATTTSNDCGSSASIDALQEHIDIIDAISKTDDILCLPGCNTIDKHADYARKSKITFYQPNSETELILNLNESKKTTCSEIEDNDSQPTIDSTKSVCIIYQSRISLTNSHSKMIFECEISKVKIMPPCCSSNRSDDDDNALSGQSSNSEQDSWRTQQNDCCSEEALSRVISVRNANSSCEACVYVTECCSATSITRFDSDDCNDDADNSSETCNCKSQSL